MSDDPRLWHWPSRISDAKFDAKQLAKRVLGADLARQARGLSETVLDGLGASLSFGAARRGRLADRAWARGDVEQARKLWQSLADDEPYNPIWSLRLSRIANAEGDYELAEKILLDARDRGALNEELENGIVHYGRWRRHSNAAIEEAIRTVSDLSASPFKVFFSSVYLSSEGRLEPAREGLNRLVNNRRLGHSARAQLAALDILEKTAPSRRADIPGWLSPARSSAVVRAPGSDTVVVAFAPPGGLFGVPVNVLHAMLPPNVNAIYLYDSKQLYHLAGTDRFGPGYQTMISGLRETIADMGAKNVITIGPSAAGFTALCAGLDLKAQSVVAFSPPTNTMRANMEADGRFPHILLRSLREIPQFERDLRPQLEDRDCCPQIDIYYGGDHPQDRMHAEHLDGVRGVNLHPVSGLGTHDSVSELVLRGQLGTLGRGLGDK
jgi:tetratricopeptide (TPR) repeat protein